MQNREHSRAKGAIEEDAATTQEKQTVKKLLTVSEAAEVLGTSERALWQRIYRGQVPYRKWGGKTVIPVADLEEFLSTLPGITVSEATAKAEAAAH
jgi:excisionase family DNA binding protein